MRPTNKATIALIAALGVMVATGVAAATAGGHDDPVAVGPLRPAPEPPVQSSSGIHPAEPGDPGPPMTTAPDPHVDPIDQPSGQPVTPTPGMNDLRPIGWTTATIADDDRTLTIDFVTGVAPCSVLDHIDVAYDAKRVTVTLYEGSEPGSGHVACPEIAMFASTTLVLDQPLGERQLVDGVAD